MIHHYETLLNNANRILMQGNQSIRLKEFRAAGPNAGLLFTTNLYTLVVIVLSNDSTISAILEVIDRNKPFSWYPNGLPGPGTKKIAFSAAGVSSPGMHHMAHFSLR